MTERFLWRTPDGEWRYTSVAMAREEAGFLTIEEYIRRRQNTVTQYTATQSLLDLCEGVGKGCGGASRDAVVRTGGN